MSKVLNPETFWSICEDLLIITQCKQKNLYWGSKRILDCVRENFCKYLSQYFYDEETDKMYFKSTGPSTDQDGNDWSHDIIWHFCVKQARRQSSVSLVNREQPQQSLLSRDAVLWYDIRRLWSLFVVINLYSEMVLSKNGLHFRDQIINNSNR